MISFSITLFSTFMAIPYLQSCFRYLSCHEINSCLSQDNLYMFIVNVPMLLVFLGGYYYNLKCLDLNFNIPIENYDTPWTTLRPQSIIIPLIIHIGTALTFVFEDDTVIVVIMQVLVFLALALKSFFKHRNKCHIINRVNLVDSFMCTFLLIMVLMGLLVS